MYTSCRIYRFKFICKFIYINHLLIALTEQFKNYSNSVSNVICFYGNLVCTYWFKYILDRMVEIQYKYQMHLVFGTIQNKLKATRNLVKLRQSYRFLSPHAYWLNIY